MLFVEMSGKGKPSTRKGKKPIVHRSLEQNMLRALIGNNKNKANAKITIINRHNSKGTNPFNMLTLSKALGAIRIPKSFKPATRISTRPTIKTQRLINYMSTRKQTKPRK